MGNLMETYPPRNAIDGTKVASLHLQIPKIRQENFTNIGRVRDRRGSLGGEESIGKAIKEGRDRKG